MRDTRNEIQPVLNATHKSKHDFIQKIDKEAPGRLNRTYCYEEEATLSECIVTSTVTQTVDRITSEVKEIIKNKLTTSKTRTVEGTETNKRTYAKGASTC